MYIRYILDYYIDLVTSLITTPSRVQIGELFDPSGRRSANFELVARMYLSEDEFL